MHDKYAGMTVNERLVVSGLMRAFDKSVKRKDIAKTTEILESVGLDEVNILSILEQLIATKR